MDVASFVMILAYDTFIILAWEASLLSYSITIHSILPSLAGGLVLSIIKRQYCGLSFRKTSLRA